MALAIISVCGKMSNDQWGSLSPMKLSMFIEIYDYGFPVLCLMGGRNDYSCRLCSLEHLNWSRGSLVSLYLNYNTMYTAFRPMIIINLDSFGRRKVDTNYAVLCFLILFLLF